MTVTIYTISNDQFCTAEKEYLTSKGIQFAEKNIESNREFLSEMLAASDNFSGVPFTIIVKDDGSTVKLKGFTKEEFESALSGVSASAPSAVDATAVSTPASVPVVAPVDPTVASQPPAVSTSTATNGNGNVQKDLEGVLNTLSSMTDVAPVGTTSSTVTTSTATAPASATPTTGVVPADMPAVPDFSQSK